METDAAPAWQCPVCGIAIAKYQASLVQAKGLGAAIVAVPEQTEPGLAPLNRVTAAAPDVATACLFLWCWLAPAAWRPTLASELGLLMLMEFFALHSGMFLGGTASVQRESIGVRLVTAMIVMAFYVPVAGAFAYFHGGWSPFLVFGWLLLTRVISMLAGQGSGEFESKRQRFYWGAGVGYYVVCIIPVLLLPVPQLGLRNATDLFWDKWWVAKPQEVIAWGFLYFGALAVTKLCEKPEWIERQDEPA
jgi:hypothetical protein